MTRLRKSSLTTQNVSRESDNPNGRPEREAEQLEGITEADPLWPGNGALEDHYSH
jgi:hypothetical protein